LTVGLPTSVVGLRASLKVQNSPPFADAHTHAMRPRIYIESSVISYLTSRTSRDLVVAAHQQVTLDFWESVGRFDMCISAFVVAEVSKGDEERAQTRMNLIASAAMLETSPDVEELADALIEQKSVPAKARLDALHIAVCAVHGVDYLLTWNCKHIANAQTMSLIENTCAELGYPCPRLCTPLELLEK
jgi:predicted nucleic acid-binding protein